MDGIVTQYGDITIYSDDIAVLCEQYITTLPDPSMIYKASVFRGLLDYLYRHCLKNVNIRKAENKAYLDYQKLDKLFFELYLPLTYKYNSIPSIMGFCSMLHISNEGLSDVKQGYNSNGNARVNKADVEIVKKWSMICESSLYDKATTENSIGAIFGLKAGFGWKEAVASPEPYTLPSVDSPEQIAARHAQAALNMPEKPDL